MHRLLVNVRQKSFFPRLNIYFVNIRHLFPTIVFSIAFNINEEPRLDKKLFPLTLPSTFTYRKWLEPIGFLWRLSFPYDSRENTIVGKKNTIVGKILL